jgi:hypothetical protein
MPSRVQDTIPAPNLTNNLFHALANDNDEDTPSATTWSPLCHPHYPLQCQEHQLHMHASHLPNKPLPRDLSLTMLLLQVCSIQPHNQTHHHFQGCLKHQTLLLIAQGHILHHRTTVPWWHWYNTISLPPKQHGLHTPWPPNLPAYAKPWHFQNLSLQNLPASARG